MSSYWKVSVWQLLSDLANIVYRWINVAFQRVFVRSSIESTVSQTTVAPTLLFRLPHSLLINILSEWLDIGDVARIDVALTNHTARTEWLECLQHMKSTTANGQSFNAGGKKQSYSSKKLKSSSMLYWICRRRINVESIDLDELDDAFVTRLHLPPSVQKLYLMEASEASIIHLINTVPNLRSVKVWYCGNTKKKILGHGLRHIALKCPLLENFTLSAPMFTETKEDLLFLFSQCLQLKGFSLGTYLLERYTDDDLQQLRKYAHRTFVDQYHKI